MNGIKLSEVENSLEQLKKLCGMHETCSTCWLYDPREEETACLLVKTKIGSLSKIIEEVQRYIELTKNCIMPECPYCPSCEYGLITFPEDTMPGEVGSFTEWHCLYDPEIKKNENTVIPDSLADAPGADQDDRSDT